MLRSIILALVLCIVTSAADAQSYALRNREGRATGTIAIGMVHRLPGGGYGVCDNTGRTTGIVTRRR